jgi:hypothetical protein
MPLNSIVNVNITPQTTAIPIANFGIPLVLGTNKAWTDLARSYASLADVAADFGPTTPEYISAQSIFGQTNAPTSMYVGRRQADVVTLNVLTGMFNQIYNVTIDNVVSSVNTNTLQQKSSITWSGNFTTGSPVQLINVKANGTTLGTVTSYITYSTNFNSNSTITTTVNGIELTPPVAWTTDQATTIAAVATQIAGATGVASATAGTDQIVVVFTNPGNNTVKSSIVSGTGSQPTTTIVEGGFQFNTNQATTIGAIATAIAAVSTVFSATASGDTISVVSNTGSITTLSGGETYFGGAQPTATIVNDSLNKDIANALVTQINANSSLVVTAAYTGSPDGTFTITSASSGGVWSLSTSTNISTPNQVIIDITNIIINNNYFVTLNGDTYSFLTTPSISTAEQIVQGLVPQINENTGLTGISATDNSNGSFTVTGATVPLMQNSTFYCAVDTNAMAIIKGINTLPIQPTDTVATTLTNILNFTGPTWYALSCTDRTVSTVLSIAAWVESQTLIFGTASDDANIINLQVGVDTTSIAAQLQNLGYSRTFCMYHQDAASIYPECAWFGAVLPMTPGSETWKFKQLAGIPYSPLTTNQDVNALAKNCNTYEFIGGVGITQNGTMAVGEYIDIQRGLDWLTSVIIQNVYGLLVNSPKVPYTNAGITSVQSQIQMALQQGVDNNFLTDDPAFTVTVPLAQNISSADKAARILRNVLFTATLAGAIQSVTINGTVSV